MNDTKPTIGGVPLPPSPYGETGLDLVAPVYRGLGPQRSNAAEAREYASRPPRPKVDAFERARELRRFFGSWPGPDWR